VSCWARVCRFSLMPCLLVTLPAVHRVRDTSATSQWRRECSARRPFLRSAIPPGIAGPALRDKSREFFRAMCEGLLLFPGSTPGATARVLFHSQAGAGSLAAG